MRLNLKLAAGIVCGKDSRAAPLCGKKLARSALNLKSPARNKIPARQTSDKSSRKLYLARENIIRT
ncbi:MAG: hypothetical protein ACFNVQ_04805, partial [Campylobacter sp.]